MQQAWAEGLEALIRVQNSVLRWIEQLPLASFDHIWVDVWEVLLLYLSFWMIYRACLRPTVRNTYVALSALLLCTSCHSFSAIIHTPQRSLVFYNVRGCPSVHCLTDGSCSWLVRSEDSAGVSYLQRALSPYWNRLHLERPTLITGDCSLPELSVRNQIVSYAGKRICLLYDNRWQHKTADAPIAIDYLYVSRGYKGDLKELLPLFTVGTVMFDSSFSAYYRERMINDCIRRGGDSYLSLSEKGSVRILL